MQVTAKSLALSLILFCAKSIWCQAADEGAVTGIVIDRSTGAAMKDVLVTALSDNDLHKKASDPSSSLHQRVTQLPKGDFIIPGLVADDWCFLAYKEGYNSYRSSGLLHVNAKDTVDSGVTQMRKAGAPAPPPGKKGLNHFDVVLVMYRRADAPKPVDDQYHIDIHVTDSLDRPVPHAFVAGLEYSGGRLADLPAGNGFKGSGFTNRDGYFHSGVLPATDREQQYVLTVSKYGYHSSVVVEGWLPGGTIEITLERPLEVSERGGVSTAEATQRKVFTGEYGRTLEALPLPGMRSFDLLSLLSPGILEAPETAASVGPGFAPGLGTAGSFVANGLRARENSFTVDDGDDNDEIAGIRRQGFIVPTAQAIESLQEFQTISALPDARFGRVLGAQVNVVTKPAVGGYHGTVYGFFTDRVVHLVIDL